MVALLKTLLPLFLLLDNRIPLHTLKASADEDSCCCCRCEDEDDEEDDVNAWLSLHSLFVEHSLPTLSFTMLEEAHKKLLLRLVAEEVDKDMEEEEDEDMDEEGGWDDDVDEEEEDATAVNEDEGKEQDCISSPVMLLVLSCSPETAKGSVLVESRVTNLDVG